MRHPLLFAVLAFVVWSAAFLVVYGMQATGCRLGWSAEAEAGWASPLRLLLMLLVLATIGGILGILAATRRRAIGSPATDTDAFLKKVAIYVTVAALFSATFCFAGVAWLTLCTV